MTWLDWLLPLFSIITLAIVFAFCVVRLSSKFSSVVLELARLAKANSVREVVAQDHADDRPVFLEPPSDESEAELEELMVQRRAQPPHDMPGPRLRGE